MKFLYLMSVGLLLISCSNKNKVAISDKDLSSKHDQNKICYQTNLSKFLNNSLSYAGAKFPEGFSAKLLDFKGKDLTFVDLSKVTYLTASDLNQASLIKGIKLPDNFDVKELNTEGKDVSYIDFSKTKNFHSDIINKAQNFLYVKFPTNFDFSKIDVNGRPLVGLDLRQVQNFKIDHLNNSFLISRLTFPVGFRFTGFEAEGKSIIHTDLSTVGEFTVDMLNDLAQINYSKMPALDLTSYTTLHDLTGVDFSLVSNYDESQLWNVYNDGKNLNGLKLPAGFNLTHNYGMLNIDYTGVNILLDAGVPSMADFYTNSANMSNLIYQDISDPMNLILGTSLYDVDLSQLSLLTVTSIDHADLSNVKFPSGFDFSGMNFSETVSRIDFSDTTNLSFTAFSNFQGNILPDNLDISAVDFAGSQIDFTDFSNVIGLTAEKLNDTSSYLGIKIPDNFDIENLDTYERELIEFDFSKTDNFKIEHIKDAKFVSKIKVPSNLEINKLDSYAKFIDWDFSEFIDSDVVKCE